MLAIALLGFFLITLDISIVNVALAAIRGDLGGGTTLQQWVIDGYTLLFAALLLFAGTVSDRISLYLQQDLGLAPLHAGLAFLPSAFFAIAGNLTSGPITNRYGPRVPVVLGQLAMVTGLVAVLATAGLRSPVITALCLIPIGAGGSLAMPPVTGVVLDGVDPQLAGTASAVFNTFRQVGGAVAIAVFGALIAGPHTFLTGMRVSLAIAAALLLATAATSLTIPHQRQA